MTFKESVTNCESLGGNLARVDSAQSQNYVTALLEQNAAESAWIGGEVGYDAWHWVPGAILIYDQGCYRDNLSFPDLEFLAKENSAISEQSCIALCSEYQYASLQYVSANLQQCRCGKGFGENGYPNSAVDCFKPCSAQQTTNCGKLGNQHVFTVGVPEYSHWVQAANRQTAMCALLNTTLTPAAWQQADCINKVYGYICHNGSPGKCDYQNSCFSIHKTKKNWLEARSDCFARGGDLVQLDNQDIMDQLSSVIEQGEWWIGLARFWAIWRNDDDVGFSQFALGEPSAYSGCLVAAKSASYNWTLKACTATYPSVCLLENYVETTTGAINSTVGQPYTGDTSVQLSIGAAIGIGVAVFVLLIAVVVIMGLFIAGRKRGRRHRRNPITPPTSSIYLSSSVRKDSSKRSRNDQPPPTPMPPTGNPRSNILRGEIMDINSPLPQEGPIEHRLSQNSGKFNSRDNAAFQEPYLNPVSSVRDAHNLVNQSKSAIRSDEFENASNSTGQVSPHYYEPVHDAYDFVEPQYTGLQGTGQSGDVTPPLATYDYTVPDLVQ